jgi:hypothetical protein
MKSVIVGFVLLMIKRCRLTWLSRKEVDFGSWFWFKVKGWHLLMPSCWQRPQAVWDITRQGQGV